MFGEKKEIQVVGSGGYGGGKLLLRRREVKEG
jgi:hypothetical protein